MANTFASAFLRNMFMDTNALERPASRSTASSRSSSVSVELNNGKRRMLSRAQSCSGSLEKLPKKRSYTRLDHLTESEKKLRRDEQNKENMRNYRNRYKVMKEEIGSLKEENAKLMLALKHKNKQIKGLEQDKQQLHAIIMAQNQNQYHPVNNVVGMANNMGGYVGRSQAAAFNGLGAPQIIAATDRQELYNQQIVYYQLNQPASNLEQQNVLAHQISPNQGLPFGALQESPNDTFCSGQMREKLPPIAQILAKEPRLHSEQVSEQGDSNNSLAESLDQFYTDSSSCELSTPQNVLSQSINELDINYSDELTSQNSFSNSSDKAPDQIQFDHGPLDSVGEGENRRQRQMLSLERSKSISALDAIPPESHNLTCEFYMPIILPAHLREDPTHEQMLLQSRLTTITEADSSAMSTRETLIACDGCE